MDFQRRHKIVLIVVAILILLFFILIPKKIANGHRMGENQIEIQLPDPIFSSRTSIEEALKQRRSIRTYKSLPLTLQEISQLLWAAQGITSSNGFRTTPSAGALYPLELYIVSGNIEKLPPGVYHYLPGKHQLQKVSDGDIRIMLTQAANGQEAVQSGAVDIVISAEFSRTTNKYGDKGTHFVFMEAGHAAQNIYLQSVSLNLGTVSIGVFDEKRVKEALGIKEEPLYILPVGKIADQANSNKRE